jgi:hypothetical protein
MCRRGPPLFGYIHPQEVANLGAFSIERHQNIIINSGLEGRFGGYTAHHPICFRGPVTSKDLPEAAEKPGKTRLFSSKDPLDDLIGHSITYRIAMGPRAGIDIEPAQRQKLERLCRYVSRPPVAVDRIALIASG